MSAEQGYEVVHQPDADRFALLHEGTQVGVLTYQRTGDRAALLHTEVLPRLRGRGLARDLVLAAVGWARQENLKLTPLCWYTRVVLERGDEYRDVL